MDPAAREKALAQAQAVWQHLTQSDESAIPKAFRQMAEEARLIGLVDELPLPALAELAFFMADDPHRLTGREEILFELLKQIGLRSPKLAFDIKLRLCQTPNSGFDPTLQGTFGGLASADPRAALAQWRSLKDDLPWEDQNDRARTLSVIFRQWQHKDFDGALAALEKMPNGEEKKHARYGLAYAVPGLFSSPPESWRPDATELSKQLLAGVADETFHYGWIIRSAVSARLEVELPEATLAWCQSLEFSPTEDLWAARTVAEGWANKIMKDGSADPSAAWDWLVASVPESARSPALAFAVEKWSRADQDAADPFSQQGAPPDLAACSEWLIAQGLGPASQEAMAMLAKAWGQQYEPEAALAWARAIPDKAQRRRAEDAVEEELNKRFPTGWETSPEERTR